ncbi:MAG: hypothetical protein LBN93_11945 [Candidatus Symbiothrix sp.]|jgi:hypothetical protein|nr:hypothetical protein [Candidatus Symbiothrix sp.]
MTGIKNIFGGLRGKPAMTGQEQASEEAVSGEIFAAIALALHEGTGQSDEVFAAIALALSGATEWHDLESNVLTIHNVENNYSPWSSKIYSLRELPLRR